MRAIHGKSLHTLPRIAYWGCAILLGLLFVGSITAEPEKKEAAKPDEQKAGQEKSKTEQKAASDSPGEREDPEARRAPRYATLPVDARGFTKPLSMEQTIRMVLNNNNDVTLQQLEILKSDTELLKDESQYSPVLEAGYQGSHSKDKTYPGYASTGNITDSGKTYAKIKKLFKSGTYFELEGSDTRYDTNANEITLIDQLQGSGGDPYRPQRPLHTGALKIVLQQELLKNAFGYNQQRINDINRNNARIQRENMIYQLTGLVVQAMTDYWNLSITNEQLQTSEILLKNTRDIRAITLRKRNIGLAEGFEVNQWNALVARAETSLDMARLDRDNKTRELLRTLNLDPSLKLSGRSDLMTALPKDLNREKDLDYAYKTRPDFQAIRLQMKNTRKAHEIAENQLLPSVSLGGSYSSRSFGYKATSAWNDVPSRKYPEVGVEFKVEYPLYNETAKVDARNSKIDLRKLQIEEEKLHRQIRDEIYTGYDQINISYRAMQNAGRALKETNSYYGGLVYRYRQGRFTAVAVKEALDQLAQARQSYTEARINYNISVVRYDFIRNKVFSRYNIDINKVLDRLMTDQAG